MKKLVLCAFLLLLTGLANAQIDGSFNNSIGVRVFGSMQIPKIQNNSKKDNYVNNYMNAVVLKFNDNQISYRLTGSYFKDNLNLQESDAGSGEITDYAFKMGFEKNFNYAMVQPYFLMDLGYRSHEFNGLINTSTLANVTKHGFTIAPGFGIKLNIVRRITLFAEGNIEFFYFQNKQETTDQGATASVVNKNYRSQFLLNPIATGVQFHFGNNR
jgi:hypothetical protein